MFTGIVEELGTVLESGSGRLRIRAPKILSDAAVGDSIAINGVDLTVAEIEGDTFLANLMPETYRRSALGDLRPGDLANLEPSVRPDDRLSGHLVRESPRAWGRSRPTPAKVMRSSCTSPRLPSCCATR